MCMPSICCYRRIYVKRVLIFGIGGFVGPYLAREFEKNGYEVIGSDVVDVQGIKCVKANLLDAEAIAKLVSESNVDIIVNLAAISSVGASWNMPQTTISVNVLGALNIMEAARKMEKQPRVLFVGSSEEYAVSDADISEKTALNANNPYGISKATQESFAAIYRERYGMKIYCVRPFNHTGVGQKDNFVLPSFAKQVAEVTKSGKAGVMKVGNLAAIRDFSDVRDVVRAYRMIVEQDNCETTYNVGSGKCFKIEELLRYLISLSNQEIDVQVDPDRFRPVDTPRICCDNTKIRTELGWEPKYSIFDTLKEMYEYYLAN